MFCNVFRFFHCVGHISKTEIETAQKKNCCLRWDAKGLIYFKLLKPGETVMDELYC